MQHELIFLVRCSNGNGPSNFGQVRTNIAKKKNFEFTAIENTKSNHDFFLLCSLVEGHVLLWQPKCTLGKVAYKIWILTVINDNSFNFCFLDDSETRRRLKKTKKQRLQHLNQQMAFFFSFLFFVFPFSKKLSCQNQNGKKKFSFT